MKGFSTNYTFYSTLSLSGLSNEGPFHSGLSWIKPWNTPVFPGHNNQQGINQISLVAQPPGAVTGQLLPFSIGQLPRSFIAKRSKGWHQTFHKNTVRKGKGPDSCANSPDPDDHYNYASGPAYNRMCALRPSSLFTTVDLIRLIDRICTRSVADKVQVPKPRRMAKRRRAVAWAWLDTNWAAIHSIFDELVLLP
jgi:hypothetical protein